ncbi:MAG TPA: pyridoxamine 5'-phosphate oxidase family protein [Candidatus Limnocylindrales bacterium]
MASWADFEASNPILAAAGRALLYRTETGEALLATVRGDDPPRIHPIWVGIVGGRMYAFILKSAKRTDLERDGRFALHTHVDPTAPSEFSIRGRARLVDAAELRTEVGGSWYFEVDETYELFDFDIDAAILGVRDNADEWPPRYTSWSAS